MSAIELAESMLQSGNVRGAQRILKESAPEGEARDLLLARCALRLRDQLGAVAAYSAVLTRNPRHLEAAVSLGGLYAQLGWLDKAEAHFSRTLKRLEEPALRVELASLHWLRKQPARALQELGRVLARQPDHFDARQRRAQMLVELGRHAEALEDLRLLAQKWPDRPRPWKLLGMAELGCHNPDEAARCLREAVRNEPVDVNLATSLATALIISGQMEEAMVALERLRELDAAAWQGQHESTRKSRIAGSENEIDPRPIFLLTAFAELQKGCWARRDRFERILRDVIARPGNASLVSLWHSAGIVSLSAEERLKLYRTTANEVAKGVTPFRHEPSATPARLRIGYVMPRVGDHVVAKILGSALPEHDPATTDIHVFAVAGKESDRDSATRQRYLALPGVTLHDLAELDDAAAAEYLLGMQMDVLVDVAVYLDSGRPGILARRPAPVQVSYLGGTFSSGSDWLDYILVDDEASPGQPGWCSEAEVRMTGSYFLYSHEDALPPEPPPRSALGLPEDRFLYSALNNTYKLSPVEFDSWARILAATPGSVLLLKDGEGIARNLRAEAERRGLDPARLLFVPHVSQRDYLLRQGMPDLFLDTFLYGGHTTMAESLWMGVPAVSRRGDSFQSRVGASLLASCGLGELVATDVAAYEELAIALFHDRDRLLRLKQLLRQSRLTAAPFDVRGQVRQLERAFRHMRDRFAAGLPPAPFAVAELPVAD